MEKEDKKYTHIAIRDGHGRDYLCPSNPIEESEDKDLDLNVCFEKNVSGRLAARINIRES